MSVEENVRKTCAKGFSVSHTFNWLGQGEVGWLVTGFSDSISVSQTLSAVTLVLLHLLIKKKEAFLKIPQNQSQNFWSALIYILGPQCLELAACWPEKHSLTCQP